MFNLQVYPNEIVEAGDGDMSTPREWSINDHNDHVVYVNQKTDGIKVCVLK